MNSNQILQPPNSQLCSVYALKKAFTDQKINLEVSEIQKYLDISDDYGIGLYDLALYPLQVGLQVKAFAFETAYMPHQWLNQSSDYLKQYLQNEPKLVAWQQSMLKGLERGVQYNLQIISLDEIKKTCRKPL